jgi:quercetin dioxygenase-like cupin family protein
MHSCFVKFMIVLLVLLIGSLIPASAEPVANISDPGVIIPASSLRGDSLTGEISVIDILPLLQPSGNVNMSMPASVAIITMEPEQEFSPNAVRPGAEMVYILAGSAEISADNDVVHASKGEAILVPRGSVMMVKNTGEDLLSIFSILSADVSEKVADQGLMKRSLESKTPVMFGNKTGSDSFSVNRMYSTFEEPLPISFDLAVISVPSGNSVRDHYMESGELGYVISGTGNVSIGCNSHVIGAGDIIYVPPYAVQRYDVKDAMTLLLLTEPFYRPEQDYSSSGLC